MEIRGNRGEVRKRRGALEVSNKVVTEQNKLCCHTFKYSVTVSCAVLFYKAGNFTKPAWFQPSELSKLLLAADF